MSERIQTGDGRVHFGACTHINKSSPLSDDDARWLGEKADVATAGGKGFQGKEALITAGGCELGVYQKTSVTTKQDFPEAWYSHKKGGGRRDNPTWHVTSTQPDSPWRDHHLEELKRVPTWASCIFSDSAGMYSYTQGGKPAIPPQHSVEYKPPEWLSLIGGNLREWEDQTGKRFLVNGLSRETVDLYRPTVGMVEGTFRSQTGKLPDQNRWEETASLLLEAQAKGWTCWALVKLGAGADRDPARRDAWRSLGAPSMLLLDAGSLLFDLCGMEGSEPPWVTREYDHPSYSPDIGAPKTSAGSLVDVETKWPGVYRRAFERGAVWVNSTGREVSVTASRVVGAQSGVVFKRKPRRRV